VLIKILYINLRSEPAYTEYIINLTVVMTEYLGVLLYIAIAAGLGIVILFASYKVRPRRLDLEKATAYECGFEPFGEARSPFDVGFY